MELTKDQLSLKLAESFEPKPKLFTHVNDPSHVLANEISPLKWWTWKWNGINYDWQPLPHDRPEIVVRLLKWLIERGATITAGGPRPDRIWGTTIVEYLVDAYTENEQAERAIAEAALLAKGGTL